MLYRATSVVHTTTTTKEKIVVAIILSYKKENPHNRSHGEIL